MVNALLAGIADAAVPDFDTLKAEAVAALQHLCTEWTDYNAHDPGVTLVELLSYALTDLGYRAGLPIADLIAAQPGTAPQPGVAVQPQVAESDFFSAIEALVSPPVTAADFRRLLLDRVERLGDVWMNPREDEQGAGLYDIRLYAAPPLPGVPWRRPRKTRRLMEQTRRVFLQHRPLCEDIGSIAVLQPLRIVVSASLRLEPGDDPDEVAAEAIYRLALALAPEPQRTGLDPRRSLALALDGPLLHHGLIPEGELVDKPAVIDLAAIAEVLAGVAGVIGVAEARLWVQGAGLCRDGRHAVDRDSCCALDAGLEGEGELPLAFSIDGRPCPIDRARVRHALAQRWMRRRRPHPLAAAYRQAPAAPAGRPRALTRFAPLGPQLPRIYGLSDPSRGGQRGDAAAAQLGGYLAIFEAVMTDYCASLAEVRGLVEGRAPAGLANEGREALLDFLLALFGAPQPIVPAVPRLVPEAAVRHRIARKQVLLDHREVLARRRGRGFDPEGRRALRRVSGLELYARLLLAEGERPARLFLVEHTLLRPRTPAQRQPGPSAGMAASVVLELPAERRQDAAFLREVHAAIRAELPAHIALRLHLANRDRWRSLRRLHRLWRMALRLGDPRPIDQLSADLRDSLDEGETWEP